MSQDGADAILAAVQRRAMEIVELPAHLRDQRYAEIHNAYRETALETGQPAELANEWADMMVKFTKSMVGILEAGGGAGGGNA